MQTVDPICNLYIIEPYKQTTTGTKTMTKTECKATIDQAVIMGVLSTEQATKRIATIKSMLTAYHYARHSGIRELLVNDLPALTK
tara:strand:+ start:90 stop:344 length:255 start_codon:yes stop_codon:yes gene_type:complete